MDGTVLITGSNGSLAIPAVAYLLEKYPGFTAVLTVRDDAQSDPNTQRLRDVVAKHPDAKVSIRRLDLADLSAVHEFIDKLRDDIESGTIPPLRSIVANAYYWNLNQEMQLTKDGMEKSIAVSHVAHVALVMRLVDKLDPQQGRMVLFSSEAHWPGKNSLEKIAPALPEDLDALVKPPPDKSADVLAYGFQRYANSKLAITAWSHALNARLEVHHELRGITAVAINPGNLPDSRALRVNTPRMLSMVARFVLPIIRPILARSDPTMRSVAEAGKDVIELAIGKQSPGLRGFFTMLRKDESSPESNDKKKQDALWFKSAQWARVEAQMTPLPML